MYTGRGWGFTLIELLVVIAIIGILAGFLAVGLPRALELAKIRDVETDFNGIRNALSVYSAQHGSYPPAYGYYTGYNNDANAPLYYLTPYMARIGELTNEDLFDRFSTTDDANQNGVVDRLEFTPVGIEIGPGRFQFIDDATVPYNGGLAPSNQSAPYIYLPVNKRQATQYATWFWKKWKASGMVKYMYGIDDGADNPISAYNMTFPPTQYDDYVLISVGPWGQTGGIADNAPPAATPALQYHMDVMRAYFLATRDANENKQRDFDFRTRKLGEGKRDAYAQDGLYHLPNEFAEWQSTGFTGSGLGPMIDTP
ncbi:MAG TPA: type II secretion system protein [Candidatus Hydrogenedentes bacterium]|mgnify:FL=1|nr:type II secretion system protein [Candidatus Hydrogenedentota bacterium]HQH67704.1 type II secretion system protein [Candidatus Hydrogenedentota bacterium]